jgi:type VI secretion system secreted protein VgrG
MSNIVTAYTALSPEVLKFRSMVGNERLSSLFEFRVELVSSSASLDLKSLLGKSLSMQVQLEAGGDRYLDGQVVSFEFCGRETSTSRSYIYAATLRPWLWYLTLNSDCRIFQDMTVVEIVQQVLAKYGFPVQTRLAATYRQWSYCVQYQESDFAFVSRLMEHEGIYYYFKHEKGQHTLVLADDTSGHDTLPGFATLPYQAPDRIALPEDEGVDRWYATERLRPGRYVVSDYDFRKPKADLQHVRANPIHADHGAYEKYDWQGGYINVGDGDHYAQVRLEAEQTDTQTATAHTTLRAIAPGYLFTLTNCPRASENREYLIVGVDYRLQEGGYATGSSESHYDFNFLVQPTSLAWRAPCATPIPKATGPQTAVVVGPSGEQIWTDQYGRVKLQFRWDRYGKRDENSSCWVRVSDAWAGSGYGGIFIPRIGQEVVVDFLNGCLDRPLITGRVYNADQMPPFNLPASATQSGVLTRTPGGSTSNANMFRFEDKQGSEQVKLHAERNFDVSVEQSTSHSSGQRHTISVGFPAGLSDGSGSSAIPALQGLLQQAQSAGSAATSLAQQAMAASTSSRRKNRRRGRTYRQPEQSTPASSASSAGQSVISALTQAVQQLSNVSGTLFSLTVQGISNTIVLGESTTAVVGSNALTVAGNNAIAIVGSGESVITNQVDMIGSHIAAIGSDIGQTGSSVSNTGSEVSNTGVSVHSVGYAVTL